MLSKTRRRYVTCLISLEFIALPSMRIMRITRVRAGNIPEGAMSAMAYPENRFLRLEEI